MYDISDKVFDFIEAYEADDDLDVTDPDDEFDDKVDDEYDAKLPLSMLTYTPLHSKTLPYKLTNIL